MKKHENENEKNDAGNENQNENKSKNKYFQLFQSLASRASHKLRCSGSLHIERCD